MIRSQKIDDGSFKFSPKKALLIAVNYFLGVQFVYPLIGALVTKFLYSSEDLIHPSIQMAIYLIGLIVSVWIVKDELKASWKYFTRSKEILTKNIIEILKAWGLLILFSIIIGVVTQLILGANSQAGNQVEVENQFQQLPILTTFAILGFAPIVEELVFRGVLYQQFRSRKMFWGAVIISTALFGAIHVLPIYAVSGDITELMYLVVYCGMSFFMILAFEKTNSIFGAIGVHFLNNLIALLMML